MSKAFKLMSLAGALSVLLLYSANATVNFAFNAIHSGGTPGGPSPWATMTITNILGGVQITLTNSPTNTAGQFISRLNLLFTTLPSGANFTGDPFVTSINLGSFTDAGLSFNVKVDFKVAPPSARLLPGNSSSFTLLGVSESDFAGLNNSAMVHIQALPDGGSSKVIAPEPGSLIAIGTGLASLLGLRRRRRVA